MRSSSSRCSQTFSVSSAGSPRIGKGTGTCPDVILGVGRVDISQVSSSPGEFEALLMTFEYTLRMKIE